MNTNMTIISSTYDKINVLYRLVCSSNLIILVTVGISDDGRLVGGKLGRNVGSDFGVLIKSSNSMRKEVISFITSGEMKAASKKNRRIE